MPQQLRVMRGQERRRCAGVYHVYQPLHPQQRRVRLVSNQLPDVHVRVRVRPTLRYVPGTLHIRLRQQLRGVPLQLRRVHVGRRRSSGKCQDHPRIR